MILDTNALSALAEKSDGLIAKIRSAPRLCVTLISLGEYRYGIDASRKRKELDRWLEAFLARATILYPDLQTLPHYAAIRRELKAAGTPIPANDCWIAALVRQHKMELVTQDRHFDLVEGVRTIRW